MIIFYTNSYNGDRDESRRLLLAAADRYRAMGLSEFEGELSEDAIVIGEMGKPEIPGFEDFSISHTAGIGAELGTWAMAIHKGACGLDVQCHRDVEFMKLAERWFHADETEQLRLETSAEVFFRTWARREALVKSVGTSIVNSHLPCTTGDTADFEGRTWQLKDIEIPGADDTSAAVCAETIDEIRMLELD